ncbi:hypothetical protein HPB49_008628 [Dermacentor silvarum]|uniref:Uncharacterized protein n=1 Tax=Dermacentor silvarum TaxID=543639 RepID=A0ACB8DNV6_DERSI|nr:hypothetical protein HPB49_008628 [Dermacentor silvarum]
MQPSKMAFFPLARRPVAFGYPLVGLASQGYPVEQQGVVRTDRFRLNRQRPPIVPAAEAQNNERAAALGTTAAEQKVLPSPDVISGGGPGSTTVSGAESSFSARGSGPSDSTPSECSSLAPYWVPEEIKHYFRHRHSGSEEDDSSRKVDAALRAIGRERELPAIDDSDWSHGKCCRKPRHRIVAVMAVVTGTLFVLLLAALVTKYGVALPGSGRREDAAEGDDLMGAHIGNEDVGDMPKPVSSSEEQLRETGIAEAGNSADSRPEDVEETAGGGQEDMPNHYAHKLHSASVGRLGTDGFAPSSIWMKAVCGQPAFRFCSGRPVEFYYDGSSHACMMLSSRGQGLCNRGRNRFTSMENCRRQCVDKKAPAAECYKKAVLAECDARDVIETWWWYVDGKGCRRWRFPDGRCPSLDADVFGTSLECVRRCAESGGPPCHVPRAIPCEATQLRYGYIAEAPAHGARTRRCRELPSAGRGGVRQHCLAGANRFPTMEACKSSCMRARP